MERLSSTGSSPYQLSRSNEPLSEPLTELPKNYHSCPEFGTIGSFGGFCAFAGDPYAEADDVTRGVDPLSILPADTAHLPIWADLPGFGGDDVLAGRGLPFMIEKQAKFLGQHPASTESIAPLLSQLSVEPQKQTPTKKVPSFKSPGPSPPMAPASSHFALRDSSLYVLASGAELGDLLVEFFQQEDQENTSLLDLKTNRKKFTLKAHTAGRQNLKELTVKLRIYSLRAGNGAHEKACICCEFQRQVGDPFEFVSLYRRALVFLERSRVPIGTSRKELFSAAGFVSDSSGMAHARADTSAAHQAMTTAVLPFQETSAEEEEAGLEFLLHQAACSGVSVQNSAEAAQGLALLARKADHETALRLLERLMEDLNSSMEELGEDETESRSALLALLENAVGKKASSSMSYPLVCLIEALFQEPRCAELLWTNPAAPKIFERITGPLATAEAVVPEVSLAKLSSAVREICAVFGVSAVIADDRLATEVRERLRCCAESPSHRCNPMVRGHLEEAMNQIPMVCCA